MLSYSARELINSAVISPEPDSPLSEGYFRLVSSFIDFKNGATDRRIPRREFRHYEGRQREKTEKPYAFLSLDGGVQRCTDEMVFPFWDFVKYEKIDVVTIPCRTCVQEDNSGNKSLGFSPMTEVIKNAKYNPLKPEREIRKFETREVPDMHIQIEHEDGTTEYAPEKPHGITFWDLNTGLLYFGQRNPNYNVNNLHSTLEEATNGNCLKYLGNCLGELMKNELICVTGHRMRITDRGFIAFANYINKWWNTVGSWKSLFEGKLPNYLLDLAKYGLQQPFTVIRKNKADYSRRPLLRPKIKKPEKKKGREKIRLRKIEDDKISEIHVEDLMRSMKESTNLYLRWLMRGSSSVNVREAARRVYRTRRPHAEPEVGYVKGITDRF